MIKNYLLIAWRIFFKQRLLSLLNISGLSVGIACFLLLMLYCINESGYDRFHTQGKNIYRVYEWTSPVTGPGSGSVSMPMPLGPAMQKDFPDVINFTRLKVLPEGAVIRINSTVRNVPMAFADPQFFSLFSFNSVSGNALKALHGLNEIVLTVSEAKELFGTANAMGQVVEIKVIDRFEPFRVNAIVDDPPANSSIRFSILGNFQYLENTEFGKMFSNWYTTAFRTFVLLSPGSKLPDDAARLSAFRKKYNPDDQTASTSRVTYGLQPLFHIHTDPGLADPSAGEETIEPKTIRIIAIIAIGILLISCINYTTLSVGRSAARGKEIGVRKVSGANRKQLALQFIAESVFLSACASLLAIAIALFALPFFNSLVGKELHFSFELYPQLYWMPPALVIVVGLLCGAYPALILSGFDPLLILKNKLRLSGLNGFTKTLITVQFTLSAILILSTIILVKQTKYLVAADPGFAKENILVVDAAQAENGSFYPPIKKELGKVPGIIGISAGSSGLGAGSEFRQHGFMHEGEHKSVYETWAETDFLTVMQMKIVAGRNFDPHLNTDTINSVIVNEALMKDFGWNPENVTGKTLTGYTNTRAPVIIGVVKNINFQSLDKFVQPQLFYAFGRQAPKKIFVRLAAGNPENIISRVAEIWKHFVPDIPFQYSFLDERLNNYYRSEKRWSMIIGLAGGISIFLACLGLFGLIRLAAINRTKEIGIRKVMEASVSGIIALLSKEFLLLVFIAFCVASPVTWYLMRKWLETFAYRISLSALLFVEGGLFILVIAIFTICMQAGKAAMANPVKSLRTE